MNDNYGELIKNARNKAGLTQEKLAELLNVSISTVRGYEAGRRRPKLEGFQKIAEVCGVSARDLMGINESSEELKATKEQLFDELLNILHRTTLITAGYKEVKKLEERIFEERAQIKKFASMGFNPTPEKLQELEELKNKCDSLRNNTNDSERYLVHLSYVLSAMRKFNTAGLQQILALLGDLADSEELKDKTD